MIRAVAGKPAKEARMNGVVRQYVLIFERALEGVYTLGPFESDEAATEYAKEYHSFPQIWRLAELRKPQRGRP